MKKIVYSLSLVLALSSCQKKEEVKSSEKEVAYAKFGDTISQNGAITKESLFDKYKTMKEGDTLDVKFTSKINAVCQQKGCWMTLALPDNNEAFVKFKDYAFFVPKNANDSEAIVRGKAFVSIESIEDLKEYAKDAGESKEAIDSIKSPKTKYSFLAEAVLIKK